MAGTLAQKHEVVTVHVDRVCNWRWYFGFVFGLVAGNDQVNIAAVVVFFYNSIEWIERRIVKVQYGRRGEVEPALELACH